MRRLRQIPDQRNVRGRYQRHGTRRVGLALGAFQQEHSAGALGDGAEPPQSVAGLLRGRSCDEAIARWVCDDADLLVRGRQRGAGLGWWARAECVGQLRPGRPHRAGSGAAARGRRNRTGDRRVGGRRPLQRHRYPGRGPLDHRENAAVRAACDRGALRLGKRTCSLCE